MTHTDLSRRDFLKSSAAGAAAAALQQAAPAAAAKGRPNIIFLLTDDQRWDALGCMGNPVLKTPNIDALAQKGVRFTRACVTTSICCCSRASILTGQWTGRHGILDFKTPLAPDAQKQTYMGVLRDQGYYTGFIGKHGVGNRVPPDAYDFNGCIAQFSPYWAKDKDGGRIHTLEQDTRSAMEFLRTRPKDKPFCLSFSYRAPHAEDKAPEQYFPMPEEQELYKDATIPVPRTATQKHFEALPKFIGNEQNEGRKRWHWRFDTPQRFQSYMKDYYRLITGIDRTVGRIVAELKAQGIDDNTIILFTGDNGYFHAEKGLADKWYPYEESIRVPLVVYDPRLPAEKRGQAIDEFVLNVDLAPTMLAMAGCPIPGRMQGRDFSGLYMGGKPADWRNDFYYEHQFAHPGIPASEALVGKDYKYILWPKNDCEELFDLRSDPQEEHNLAADAKYRPVLETMRARFTQLKRETVG